jgi:Na+-transporting NADH:ubiquinone oxidoreductase subunit NqrD
MIACSALGLLYCCGFEVWVFASNSDDIRALRAAPAVYYTLLFVVPVLVGVVYAAILFGSVQMLRRKSFAWAKTASILALLPCSVFSVLSIGFGIWGLLVLRSEDVKAVFR